MAFEDTWNPTYEGIPADNENISLGAGRIRDLKVNIRERANVDHSWGDTLDNGQHNQISFNLSTSAPALEGTNGYLYTLTSGSVSDLFYQDNTGDVTRLTNAGGVGLTGEVRMWSTTTPPTAWLVCDGSAVSRATYAALFATIGTTFGAGDGSTTFNLPDARGRVVAGYDAGNATGRLTQPEAQGVTAATIGNTGGEQDHTLAVGELASHTHSLSDPGHTHTINDPTHSHTLNDPTHFHQVNGGAANAYGSGSTATDAYPPNGPSNTTSASTGITMSPASTGVTNHSATTGISGTNSTGSSSAHNNVQPTLVLVFIIKT